MELNKRFSIAHYDNWPTPSLYYQAIKNSSQEFKDEIYDIYFGAKFRYNYRHQEIYDNYAKLHNVEYGNVMGVEPSGEQVNNLFKIQQEFGIEISLTLNQLNIPIEIFFSRNNRVGDAFLDWLQTFYDRGLRSCTLANNHLMRVGILQKRFPEMKWKNTVNQQVSTAQQVLDYLYLGYNVIQLDRSLNRNMDELKRIKDAVEDYKNKHPGKYVKTCMLVWENCLPHCPFKREHDDLEIYFKDINYWCSYLSTLSCGRWTNESRERILPRLGTNCYWSSPDTFKEYAALVDIFKFHGRLNSLVPEGVGNVQFGWLTEKTAVGSFSEIIDNTFEPVHIWFPGAGFFRKFITTSNEIKESLKDNFWLSIEGRRLVDKLKNCKNQCYRCHLCERTIKQPDLDSALEL